MNPARLAELERQRALVRAHLEWLDREILTEAGSTAPATSAVLPANPPSEIVPPTSTFTRPVEMPSAIIDHYAPDPVSAAVSAKRGCLLLVAGAILFAALVLSALYYARYRGRPLLFMSGENSATEKVPPTTPPATSRK